jgi:hypothetical protein
MTAEMINCYYYYDGDMQVCVSVLAFHWLTQITFKENCMRKRDITKLISALLALSFRSFVRTQQNENHIPAMPDI